MSGSALNDPLAKCLNSMLVTINGACSLTVTPLSASDNFVTGLWGAAGTYTNLMACPVVATAAQTAASDAAADVGAAILAAIDTAIYGVHVAGAGADAIDVSTPGAVVVNRTAGAVSLQFAVSAVSLACLCPATFSHSAACLPAFSHAALLARPAPHPVPRSLARTPARPSPLQTTLAAFTQAAATQVDLAVACSAGAYGITVTGGKICALCPAGSYSDAGTGCTSCPTGTAVAAAGTSDSATCAACPVGTYAADGSSDCIPCAAGTYQDATSSGSCATW